MNGTNSQNCQKTITDCKQDAIYSLLGVALKYQIIQQDLF